MSWDNHEVWVPFGSYNDYEPPEDRHTCPKCAVRNEGEYVKEGWVPSNWIKAPHEYRAAERLGLVETGPEGAAWTVFRRPDNIPENYVIYNRGTKCKD